MSSEPQSSQRQTAFSTSVFTPGEVYATAFATATGFHYTLSVMENTTQCTKYHAKEVSPKNFIFEIVPRFRLLNMTESLCVAVKIGKTDRNNEDLKALFEKIPMALPEIDQATDEYFRCRVWLKQAVRALNDAGIVSCPDADAVVNGELRKLGEENYDSIVSGTGAAKVYVSRCSV